MKVKGIILSETGQSQKGGTKSRAVTVTKAENTIVIGRGWGEGPGEKLLSAGDRDGRVMGVLVVTQPQECV